MSTERLIFFATFLSISGCTHVPRATQHGRVLDIWSGISTKDVIRVRGIGEVSPKAKGQTARRASSRNAALVGARYQLLSMIKGVKLEGGVTVAQLIEQDSLIREIANDVVQGGEEVLVEWLSDDAAVVTLELKRSNVDRLIQQKSEREKDLEFRVDRATGRAQNLEMDLINSKMGWSQWARDSRRSWRAQRTFMLFGPGSADHWWFRWLAGGGDMDCRFPLRPCYWIMTRPVTPGEWYMLPDWVKATGPVGLAGPDNSFQRDLKLTEMEKNHEQIRRTLAEMKSIQGGRP